MPPVFAISVPIGAYHPLLRDCLASLAVQTPAPRVALLDASADPRVAETADEFGDLLAYRRHGPDKGQSDAILEGWSKLGGDVLGWLNADDALYPGALAAAAAALADENADIVYGHAAIINDDNAYTGYYWSVEPPSERLLWSDVIAQPSCFFRRAAYEKVGGLNAGLHYTMDWDLWVRLWRDGARFAFRDRVMSRVLWSPEAKTGGFGAARRRELARIIDQNASPAARVKSRIGFALNHLFEYVVPPGAARAMRQRLAADGGAIHGLGSNGDIRGEARLPIVHYGPAAVAAVRVVFSHTPAGDEVSADRPAATRREDKAVIAVFETPLAPAETAELQIRRPDNAESALVKIELIGETAGGV